MIRSIFVFIIVLAGLHSSGQSFKSALYFDDPIVIDSASTVIIPTKYSSDWSKFGSDEYANIIFYNFKNDTYKRLFEQDTYILPYDKKRDKEQKIHSSKYLLLRVKNVDHDKNGKIDDGDPAILYACDLKGENLKALTTENENVLEFTIFDKQNFALIKIQRDLNGDRNFKGDDKDYYYVKLDLNSLSMGSKIEIQPMR